jgi:deoxyadenosine/deoxycytidine kinase
LFNIILTTLPKPDLYVFLHLDPANALKNIQKRGREYEQSIDVEYLEKIRKNYFEYFKQEKNLKFLIIDTNGIDFVKNKADFETLVQLIFNEDYQTGMNLKIL